MIYPRDEGNLLADPNGVQLFSLMFYPPEGSCESSSQGVQLILFPFNWCRKRFWGFQIYGGWEAFLKFWKCFIPRRDSAKQIPKEVQLFLLMFYCWCRKRYWGFQIYMGWQAFLKSWKCFIPRREAAKAAPKGSNWYFFHLIGVGNGSGGFKFTEGERPFRNLENDLSPEGTSACRLL